LDDDEDTQPEFVPDEAYGESQYITLNEINKEFQKEIPL